MHQGNEMTEVPKSVSEYMAEIGSKGGKAKGPKKARDPAHYQRLGELHKKRARKKKKEKEKT